ncbi:MAG: neutral zinc metallopeptidase [Bdellovibrionales bacterium]
MLKNAICALCVLFSISAHASPSWCERILGGLGPNWASAQSISEKDPKLVQAGRIWARLEDFWARELGARGLQFIPSTLVIYDSVTRTACGHGLATTGPFYCPLDMKTYVSFAFWDELVTRFRAKGEAARLYVLAHEFAHHILQITGFVAPFNAAKSSLPVVWGNKLSVLHELMADAMAGYFVAHERQAGKLVDADARDAFFASAAVGDDHVQKPTGMIRPETFSHGTGEQRSAAFRRGFMASSLAELNLFADPGVEHIVHPQIRALLYSHLKWMMIAPKKRRQHP